MEGKISVLEDYSAFSAYARGASLMEGERERVLLEKETKENLERFSQKMSAEWKEVDDQVTSLKLSFADFAKKLESKKLEMSAQSGPRRRALRVRSAVSNFQESKA